MRSYVKSCVLEAIRAEGGEVFGLTSEPQSLATEAEEAWELGYPCVGDPHHEIRYALQDKGLLSVFANPNAGHLWMRPWVSHLKGYFQPGVLAVDRGGRVLYRWRCRPTRDNMSGAGQRPTPQHGAWVAAFALLPATWVAAALVAWAAVAGLAVAEVTQQFQHIPDGEPES